MYRLNTWIMGLFKAGKSGPVWDFGLWFCRFRCEVRVKLYFLLDIRRVWFSKSIQNMHSYPLSAQLLIQYTWNVIFTITSFYVLNWIYYYYYYYYWIQHEHKHSFKFNLWIHLYFSRKNKKKKSTWMRWWIQCI